MYTKTIFVVVEQYKKFVSTRVDDDECFDLLKKREKNAFLK